MPALALVAVAQQPAAGRESNVRSSPAYAPCYATNPTGPVCEASDPRPAPARARLRHRDHTLASLIGPEDYPAASLRAGEQGEVKLEITVATDGRVGGCAVLRSSGFARLDRTTCQLLARRARFWPALAADGTPVVGVLLHKARWTLPPEWSSRAGK
jgi:protein TonB